MHAEAAGGAGDPYAISHAGVHPSAGASAAATFPIHPLRRRDIHAGMPSLPPPPPTHHHPSLHRQRARHALFSESAVMGSSLPTQYESGTISEEYRSYEDVRPSFRKSSSQPARSMSPAALHSIHSPTTEMPSSASTFIHHQQQQHQQISPFHHHQQRQQDIAARSLRGRQARHALLSGESGMMATSLPSQYESGITEEEYRSFEDSRPSFRKSASQPTRPISPALSLWSPTEMHPGPSTSPYGTRHPRQPLPPHHHLMTGRSPSPSVWTQATLAARLAMSSPSKKRQLPQVPQQMTRRQPSLPHELLQHQQPQGPRSWRAMSQAFARASSGEALTPMGMYSDSELSSTRPSDRLFYAHPTRSSSSAGHRVSRAGRLSVAGRGYSPEVEDYERRDSLAPDYSYERSVGRRKSREEARRESVEYVQRQSRRPSDRRGETGEGREDSDFGSVTEVSGAASAASQSSSSRTQVRAGYVCLTLRFAALCHPSCICHCVSICLSSVYLFSFLPCLVFRLSSMRFHSMCSLLVCLVFLSPISFTFILVRKFDRPST